jgi:hypothetical protein
MNDAPTSLLTSSVRTDDGGTILVMKSETYFIDIAVSTPTGISAEENVWYTKKFSNGPILMTYDRDRIGACYRCANPTDKDPLALYVLDTRIAVARDLWEYVLSTRKETAPDIWLYAVDIRALTGHKLWSRYTNVHWPLFSSPIFEAAGIYGVIEISDDDDSNEALDAEIAALAASDAVVRTVVETVFRPL